MSLRSWPDPTAELGPRPTVIDYLFDDAARFEVLLDEIELCVEEGAFEAVRTHSASLASRLERHLRLEESSVLPCLGAGGQIIISEHAELRRLLAALQLQLDEQRPKACGKALVRLRRTMARHERNEQRLFARHRALI